MHRRETPIARTNPSGKRVWVARYTDPKGKRRSAGTYELKRDAQQAINQAYKTPPSRDTLGGYAETWLTRHPRSPRTNQTNQGRVDRILKVEIEGRPLRDWPLTELRRRHALDLVDHMLRVQGRAPAGAANILRTLSALAEDAITDEYLDANPFRGVKVRRSDPRATKQSRQPTVLSFEEMHRFASHAGQYEPMIRMLADCGLRVGELLALRRDEQDFREGVFRVSGSAWNGRVVGSSEQKRHDRSGPIPPGCLELLRGVPVRIDSPWLFPTLTGKLWRIDNLYRTVWNPARRASGIDCTPQDFRHSYCSLLRAEGIDPADLAAIAGHTVETATSRYTHALGRSYDAVKAAIG